MINPLPIALAVVLLVSALPAGEAAAQRTGTRMGQNANNRNIGEAMTIIANCIVARRPALARRWLALLPGSIEETALLDGQSDDFGVCASDDQLVISNRDIFYSPRRLRVPVALAMVRRGLPRAPAASPMAADSAPWFEPALNALPAGAAVDRGSLLAQDFGHCLSVTNWPGARALLGAREGSPEEARAFGSMRPILGACLPEGLTLEINPKSLREFVAEPFYHVLAAGERAGD